MSYCCSMSAQGKSTVFLYLLETRSWKENEVETGCVQNDNDRQSLSMPILDMYIDIPIIISVNGPELVVILVVSTSVDSAILMLATISWW